MEDSGVGYMRERPAAGRRRYCGRRKAPRAACANNGTALHAPQRASPLRIPLG